jgi:hypothetical protein
MLRATKIGPHDLAGGPQIICDSDADMAIHIHKIGDRQAGSI